MTVKFWDLTIQHCFHTIVTHRTEVLIIIYFNLNIYF